MKTISKIGMTVMFFITVGVSTINAQNISKNKMLTNRFNPWTVVVNYDEDHSRENYYLISVGNESYHKRKDGSYSETYSFFGTAEEVIEFIEEAKIALRLKSDETCTLQSKLARESGCYAAKNKIYYDTKISGSKTEFSGYSWVMKEKYMEEIILKIKAFENESQGNQPAGGA